MALVNINKGLKEEYSMNKIFSAEYDFSCVRQIARADRFARVLTKGLSVIRSILFTREMIAPPHAFKIYCILVKFDVKMNKFIIPQRRC